MGNRKTYKASFLSKIEFITKSLGVNNKYIFLPLIQINKVLKMFNNLSSNSYWTDLDVNFQFMNHNNT